MAVNTITLGPWHKGLNLTSNRDLSVFLDNNELGEATNVVLTKEGFVAPRPGCKVLPAAALYAHNGEVKILGSVRLPNGSMCTFVRSFVGGTSYVYKVFSPTHVTFYFSAPSEFTHVLMHTGFEGHSGIIFFGALLNTSYLTTDYTLTATPTIIADTNKVPGSDIGYIVKDRLFLVKYSESRFMWSPATRILDFTLVDDPLTTGTDIAGYELIEPTTPADGLMAVEFFNNSFYCSRSLRLICSRIRLCL